jgi:3-deoxy-D-manno-octulosonic-acid transferase
VLFCFRSSSAISELEAIQAEGWRYALEPIDTPRYMRTFLASATPSLIMFFEKARVPNLVAEATRLGIPLIHVDARDGTNRLAWWNPWKLVKVDLDRFVAQRMRLILCQDDDAERYFQMLLGPAARDIVSATGNSKVDYAVEAVAGEQQRKSLLTPPVGRTVVFGSVRPDEVALACACVQRLTNGPGGIRCIVVPRYPRRSTKAIVKALAGMGIHASRATSAVDALSSSSPGVILASIGELLLLYGACDVAVVCGGFGKGGGHNPIEPAAYGKPVVFGPSMHHWAGIAEKMVRRGAAVVAEDAVSVSHAVQQLLSDDAVRLAASEAGQRFVMEMSGVARRNCEAILAALEG